MIRLPPDPRSRILRCIEMHRERVAFGVAVVGQNAVDDVHGQYVIFIHAVTVVRELRRIIDRGHVDGV